MVSLLLRLEGLFVFLASLYFYNQLGTSWFIFILLWLLPDTSLVGYLKDKRLGSIIYNLVHNYLLALTVIFYGILSENTLLMSFGVIFASHVGLDRFFGFGLKYSTTFKDTHIQRLKNRNCGILSLKECNKLWLYHSGSTMSPKL